MTMARNQLNLSDIASNIARITGFKKKDIMEILDTENDIYESALAQGYSIKNHKLFKIELEHKEEREAWDGLSKRYYTLPERDVLNFKPLSRLDKALEENNETKYGEEDKE